MTPSHFSQFQMQEYISSFSISIIAHHNRSQSFFLHVLNINVSIASMLNQFCIIEALSRLYVFQHSYLSNIGYWNPIITHFFLPMLLYTRVLPTFQSLFAFMLSRISIFSIVPTHFSFVVYQTFIIELSLLHIPFLDGSLPIYSNTQSICLIINSPVTSLSFFATFISLIQKLFLHISLNQLYLFTSSYICISFNKTTSNLNFLNYLSTWQCITCRSFSQNVVD